MAFDLKQLNNFIEAGAARIAGQTSESVATQQATNAINAVSDELNIDDEAARKLVALNTYVQAKNRGIVPDDVYNDLPPSLRAVLKYSPEDLKFNQKITQIKTFGTPAVIVGGLLTALGLGVAPVAAVPAAAAALVWYLNGLANDWNDAFHWGPQMQQTTAIELYKETQKLDDIGLTDYGQFKKEEVQSLLEAQQRAGFTVILDPVSAVSRILNENNLIESLKNIITTLNAEGTVPTKKQVIAILRGWMSGPKGAAVLPTMPTAEGSAAAESGAQTGYQITPKVRATKTAQSKQTLFTGTIFGGRVSDVPNFMREQDTMITDEADLFNDVKVNFDRWIAALPGLLTYKINIKLNPFDEHNVQRQGTWAVLDIYINNNFNKSLALDSILLGPVDPTIYYPEAYRTQQLQLELPATLKGQAVAFLEQGFGNIQVIDTKGNKIDSLFGEASAAPSELIAGKDTTKPSGQDITAPTPSQPTPSSNLKNVAPEFYTARGGAVIFFPPDGVLYWNGMILAEGATDKDYRDFVSRSNAADLGEYNERNRDLFRRTYDVVIGDYLRRPLAVIPQSTYAPAPTPPPPTPPATIYPRNVTVDVDLLFVRSAPNKSSPLAGSERLYKGTVFQVTGFVQGESVEGESRWWVSKFGNYVWVGGTKEKP